MKIELTEEYVRERINQVHSRSKNYGKENINYFFEHMEYEGCNFEERTIEYSVKIIKEVINVIGTVHGGYIAGLLDELMGITVHVLAANTEFGATTSQMSFNLMKAMREGDELRIIVKVCHIGKRTAVTTAEIYRGNELCVLAAEEWGVLKS